MAFPPGFAGSRTDSPGDVMWGIEVPQCPVAGLSIEMMGHLVQVGQVGQVGGVVDTEWHSQGKMVGHRFARLEGFAARLVGEKAQDYDLRYTARLQGVGEVGPVNSGQFLGTRGQSRPLMGLELWIQPKGEDTTPTPVPPFQSWLSSAKASARGGR